LNSETTIGCCLSSIFSLEPPNEPYEVLVIDGGSQDKTIEIARKFPVRVLTCNEKGTGPARNLGLKEARGEIVCYTDSDCIVENAWLQKLANFFRKNPEVDGVGGLVLWNSEGATRLQRLSGEIFSRSQSFPKHKIKTKFGSFKGVLMDANSAYKKSTLLEAGGFGEPVGLGHELSWRLAKKGKTLVFDPDLKVFHIFPSTLRVLFQQQMKWGRDIAVLNRKYGFTLKGLVYLPYLVGKTFLGLFDFQHFSVRVLSFSQLLFWCLGRFYGLKSPDLYQLPKKNLVYLSKTGKT